MPGDWFRSPDWSSEAQAEFEKRLRRARSSNRAQYLRIKGLALQSAGSVDGARNLWRRVLESSDDYADLEAFGALEHLGDSYAESDPELAEHYYRQLTDGYPRTNLTTTLEYVKLAELLIRKGRPADLAEAERLLEHWISKIHSPFPSAHFRWNLAVIALAEARRDHDAIRQAARRALELADRGPVFSRHPTVGLVEIDGATRARLERWAR